MQLTDSNMETFLSDTIPRNRPRVLLFSRAPSPSLVYHLTALHFHGTLDFAYTPTERGKLGGTVGGKFGVAEGERKLMVYREDSSPVFEEMVRMNFVCV